LAPFGPAAAGVGALIGGLYTYQAAAAASETETQKLDKQIQSLQGRIETWRSVVEGISVNPSGQDPVQQLIKLEAELDRAIKKRRELNVASAQIPEVTVNNPNAPPKIAPTDPNIAKAIDDLILKTRILRGDFDALAPGFTQMAMGMKMFGMKGATAATQVAQLTPQQQALNQALMEFKGAQLTQDNLLPWQLYAQQIAQLDLLQQNGTISAQTYAIALAKIQFPTLTKAIIDSQNLRMAWDQLATTGINNLASSIGQIVTGSQKASEAFKAFGKAVLQMLVEMIAKAILFKIISAAIGFVGGGPLSLAAPGVMTGGSSGLGALSAGNIGGTSLVGFGGSYATGGPLAGGLISGPGTTTSDSILALLSNKEYIVNAQAARRFRPLLDAINFGDPLRMANGGALSSVPSMDAGAVNAMSSMSVRDAAPTTVNVHVPDWQRSQWAAVIEGINRTVRDGYRLQIAPA
jgi:hypothetical protein